MSYLYGSYFNIIYVMLFLNKCVGVFIGSDIINNSYLNELNINTEYFYYTI